MMACANMDTASPITSRRVFESGNTCEFMMNWCLCPGAHPLFRRGPLFRVYRAAELIVLVISAAVAALSQSNSLNQYLRNRALRVAPPGLVHLKPVITHSTTLGGGGVDGQLAPVQGGPLLKSMAR